MAKKTKKKSIPKELKNLKEKVDKSLISNEEMVKLIDKAYD